MKNSNEVNNNLSKLLGEVDDKIWEEAYNIDGSDKLKEAKRLENKNRNKARIIVCKIIAVACILITLIVAPFFTPGMFTTQEPPYTSSNNNVTEPPCTQPDVTLDNPPPPADAPSTFAMLEGGFISHGGEDMPKYKVAYSLPKGYNYIAPHSDLYVSCYFGIFESCEVSEYCSNIDVLIEYPTGYVQMVKQFTKKDFENGRYYVYANNVYETNGVITGEIGGENYLYTKYKFDSNISVPLLLDELNSDKGVIKLRIEEYCLDEKNNKIYPDGAEGGVSLIYYQKVGRYIKFYEDGAGF